MVRLALPRLVSLPSFSVFANSFSFASLSTDNSRTRSPSLLLPSLSARASETRANLFRNRTLHQLAKTAPYAGEPVDMWSAGILLFTLLVGSTFPLLPSLLLSLPSAPHHPQRKKANERARSQIHPGTNLLKLLPNSQCIFREC